MRHRDLGLRGEGVARWAVSRFFSNEIDRTDGVRNGPQSTRDLTIGLDFSYFPYFVCNVAAHGPK